MYDYDVFLSFSSKDLELARPIWQRLTLSGLRIFWSDEELKTSIGQNFVSAIQRALVASRDFVLLWTTNARESSWVEEEYQVFFAQCYLLDKSGRRLVTLCRESTLLSTLPPFLRQLQTTNSLDDLVAILGGVDVSKLKLRNEQLERQVTTLHAQIEHLQVDTHRKPFEENERAGRPGRNVSGYPPDRPAYFHAVSGKVLYATGEEQSFTGFRCRYSGRLYFSRSLEILVESTYMTAPSVEITEIVRIEFGERSSLNVRGGTAVLVNGGRLENVFFFIGECSWWAYPGLQGALNDPTIRSVVFNTSDS